MIAQCKMRYQMGLNSLMMIVVAVFVSTVQPASGTINLPHMETPILGFFERTVTQEELLESLAFATEYQQKMKRLESSIAMSSVNVRRSSTSFGQLLESLPSNQSKPLDREGLIILKASVQLLNRYCLRHSGMSIQECADELSRIPLPESELLSKCKEFNPSNASNTYRRLLPANYADGLYQMGHSRPIPKTISDSLYSASNASDMPLGVRQNHEGVLDSSRNIGIVQWAQFIEHDLAKTVQRTMDNHLPIECCAKDFRSAQPRHRHPACAPLLVETTAGRRPDIRCLSYVRSALGVDKDCRFGPAEQLNEATNELDLSQLYGVSDSITTGLRRMKYGELRAVKHQQEGSNKTTWTLPEFTEDHAPCLHNNTCYKTGDSRANIDPYVATLYTMFLRQHNSIARQIRRHKKNQRDEPVFQLARKINTALYRRIVFGEWAPVVIGREIAQHVTASSGLASQVLTDALRRGVSNEFATAASRFYFSMMPGDLQLMADWETTNEIVRTDDATELLQLKNEYYQPRDLGEADTLERIVSGVLNQKAMAMDTAYVDDVIEYRFRSSPEAEIGTDVLALDIQRGRDHGLNGYTKYVELCTGQKITNWDDLEPRLMSRKNIDRLRLIYADVDLIDLIVGGVSESPLNGATVGPTFACIIGDELFNAKRKTDAADTWASKLPSYSGAQFVCGTTRLETVPTNIFNTPSAAFNNAPVECKNLPALDLSSFLDEVFA